MEHWGEHGRMKLFMNNSMQALTSFKQEHQGLLKLHVLLRCKWGVQIWGEDGWERHLQKREFSLEQKNNM